MDSSNEVNKILQKHLFKKLFLFLIYNKFSIKRAPNLNKLFYIIFFI